MFSGIVEATGSVVENTIGGAGGRLTVDGAGFAGGARVGESIAVNGCCLTVTRCDGARLAFDVMPETARRTTLASVGPGGLVNLEAAMALGDRIGGHMVSGHVDGVGRVTSLREDGNALWVEVSVPEAVAPYLVEKGCVAVDGISLTVATAGDTRFTVSLIPHTIAVTGAGRWATGTEVNLEADLMAKYVERGMRAYAARALGGASGG